MIFLVILTFLLRYVPTNGSKIRSPEAKRRKIDSTTVGCCSYPYNKYFSAWLKESGNIEYHSNPNIEGTPYVFGEDGCNIKFGKIIIDTQEKFLNAIGNIYMKGINEMRGKIQEFINRQGTMQLINFAVLYKDKPLSVSSHLNIEFDHIPPKSATPPGAEAYANIYGNHAPTLAISNFDHRSEVWKECSTTTSKNTVHELYTLFMKDNDYKCAIFANLQCIRNAELKGRQIEKIFSGPKETAFARYKTGFIGLINLHFDYGTNFNHAYKTIRNPAAYKRPFAKYCEITTSDFKLPSDICKNVGECMTEEYKGQKYYYFYQKKKCEKQSGERLRTERNILRNEHDILTKWINDPDGANDAKMRNDCCQSRTHNHLCDKYLFKK